VPANTARLDVMNLSWGPEERGWKLTVVVHCDGIVLWLWSGTETGWVTISARSRSLRTCVGGTWKMQVPGSRLLVQCWKRRMERGKRYGQEEE
jgi:hypothetical protein